MSQPRVVVLCECLRLVYSGLRCKWIGIGRLLLHVYEYETKSEDTDQDKESKERIEDEHVVNRVIDIESKLSTGDDKTTTEDGQEQTEGGRINTHIK